jgi:hypothetical protein
MEKHRYKKATAVKAIAKDRRRLGLRRMSITMSLSISTFWDGLSSCAG